MANSDVQERSLVKKMATIMNSVGYIQKTGYNSFNQYSYVQEADILDHLREKMAGVNLFIFQEMIEHDVTETVASGKVKYLTTIKMRYTIVDGDSGEERTISTGGQGQDAGDKGIYKATTGAFKYALLKLFMISTGDDPELDQAPQGGQAPQQQQQQQAPPQSQGESDPGSGGIYPKNEDVVHAKNLLGWSDKQFIENINRWLAQQGSFQISMWKELPQEYRVKFFNIMNDRITKISGQ